MDQTGVRTLWLSANSLRRIFQFLVLFGLCAAVVAVSPVAGTVGFDKGDGASAGSGGVPLTIELDGVPSKLSLPGNAADNYFVTAVVRGGLPDRVWLARSEDAGFSVTIPPFGDGRYQLNLADERVVLALRRTGGSGQCYVFAKAPGGQVIQSAAIHLELSAPTASYCAEDSDAAVNAENYFDWLRADKVTALSVRVDPSLPGMTVHAESGGKTWALAPNGDTEFVLPMTREITGAWNRTGELHVRCDPAVHSPSEITLRAIPTRLELPPDGLSLVAEENSTVVIPGSRKFLSFLVGSVYKDDPNNRLDGADVTLRRADNPSAGGGNPPVGMARVYHLDDQQIAWYVASTGQHAGGKFATLRVVEGKAAEKQVLLTTIGAVGESQPCCNRCMTFSGKEYDAVEARNQLQELFRLSGASDVAGFLDAVAKREKEVGSEVHIITSNGNKPLAVWLRDSMSKLGWEAP
jgi:hypothetical protein